MIGFSTQGILSLIWQISPVTITRISVVFGLAVFTPLFLVAGWQDYREQAISGVVCLAIYVLLALHALLCWGLVFLIPIVLCAVLTFREKELSLFGQADFLILAHFLTAYAGREAVLYQLFVAGLIWLGCLIIWLVLYKVPGEGKTYFQIKRKNITAAVMIPALPSYAISVLLTAIVRIPLAYMFYY